MPDVKQSDPVQALKSKFVIKNEKTRWILTCRKCADSWGLKKPADGEPVHVGNTLTLLNHYASHE